MGDDLNGWFGSERLPDLQRALAAVTGNEHVIGVVVDRGLADLGGEAGLVGVCDGDAFVPRFAVGRPAQVMCSRGAVSIATRLPIVSAAATGVAVWVRTRSEAERVFPDLDLAVFGRTQSWAALPLFAARRTVGAIGLTFTEEHAFDDDERRYVSALGELAAERLGDPHGWPMGAPDVPEVVCAWCGRVRASDGTYAAHGPIPQHAGGGRSHGMCPDCFGVIEGDRRG